MWSRGRNVDSQQRKRKTRACPTRSLGEKRKGMKGKYWIARFLSSHEPRSHEGNDKRCLSVRNSSRKNNRWNDPAREISHKGVGYGGITHDMPGNAFANARRRRLSCREPRPLSAKINQININQMTGKGKTNAGPWDETPTNEEQPPPKFPRLLVSTI